MVKKDLWHLAWKNIQKNRWRSVICIVAVSIGVAAVVMIHTAGTFGQNFVSEQLSSIGIAGIAVYGEEAGSLSAEDGEQVVQTFSEVTSAMPMIVNIGTFSTSRKSGNAIFFGVSEEMTNTLGVRILYGSALTQRDVQFNNKSAVIDESLAQKLYGRSNIVGKKVHLSIGEQEGDYTVVGISKAQTFNLSSVLGSKSPYIVYVPYTCIQEGDNVDELLITGDEQDYDSLRKRVARFLSGRTQKKIQGQNISGYIDTIQLVVKSMKWVLTAIGGIAFVVAIIGVVNSMLSAVKERKREIGIYMALGAKKRDVLRLILLETVLLCATGGVIGGGLAAFLLWLFGKLFSMVVYVDFRVLLLAIGISIIFGVIAALLPAKSAAGLNPIDALRN